jgi:hypothetical protein
MGQVSCELAIAGLSHDGTHVQAITHAYLLSQACHVFRQGFAAKNDFTQAACAIEVIPNELLGQ